MQEKEDGRQMESRNYDMEHKCVLCNVPFSIEEEGLDREIAGVPVKMCGKCWEGMCDAVEENEAHMTVTCPQCDHVIGIRVEVVPGE